MTASVLPLADSGGPVVVPKPRLVVVAEQGSGAASSIVLEGECEVGSAAGCDLVLRDPAVAPRHARLVLHGESLWIEDLGAASGTRLDGLVVEEPRRLHHGQEIGVGATLLRFEDPAQALMDEMGLLESSEPAQVEPLDSRSPVRNRLPTRWLWVFALLGVVAWWIYGSASSIPAAWRVVQGPSHEVVAGEWIDLRSPDVEVGATYEATLGGVAAEQLQSQRGKLGIEVPEVSGLEVGTHSLPLLVTHEGGTVAGMSIDYRVVPRLAGVARVSARSGADPNLRVGDTIRIRGVGLAHPHQRTLVALGETGVEPTLVEPSMVEARIPVVTRHQGIRLPLVVWVGETRLEWGEPLSVSPRQPASLPIRLRTDFVPALEGWEISAPFGTMLYLRREEGQEDEAPFAVAHAARQLERAFERAALEEELGFEMTPTETGFRLSFGPGDEVAVLRPADLAMAGRVGGRVIEPELQAAWIAQSWNHLLRAFARGQAPPRDRRGTPFLRALARLVESNYERGGLGLPEAEDLEALDGKQREALEFAPLQPPATYDDLGGLWQARLENVFFGRQQVEVTLELKLVTRGERLGGSARLYFEDSVLTHGPPEAKVRGSLSAEAPPRVRLEIEFEGTPGRLALEGAVVEQGLVGRFRAEGLPREGAWIAQKAG